MPIRASAVLFAFAAFTAQAQELRILRVTPAGSDVPPANQIVIAFDRAVVPLGRMERDAAEIPVRVSPDPGCEWRWLDPAALACQLPQQRPLRPATAYTVEIAAANPSAFIARDGAQLARPLNHRFVTERPALQHTSFVTWEGPALPVIRLWFNQPVSRASVGRALSFGSAGIVVEPDLDDSESPYYTPDGEARRSWLVKPAAPLADGRPHRLVLGPGLASALGAEPGAGASIRDTAVRAGRDALDVLPFPELRFLGLQCVVNGDWALLSPESTDAACDPLGGFSLAFSAPVASVEVQQTLRLTPDPLANARPDFDPWAGREAGVPLDRAHVANTRYEVALPYALAAEREYRIDGLPGLKDAFGRALTTGYAMRFRTTARTPEANFEHARAVLESGLDSEVPVTVTNLSRIRATFERSNARGSQAGQSLDLPVAPARNVAFAMPLDVRRMVGARSGAVRGSFVTEPPTSSEPREFFAQVTPWQVHAKFGHSSLLVWVTELASGKPVAGARIAVLVGERERATASTDAQGVALLPGSAELDPKLEHSGWRPDQLLAVRVTRGEEFALLPFEHEFQVDTWRASNYTIWADRQPRHGHLVAWGTTAQGVYRAGERVQYKVYVRDAAGRRLGAAPRGPYELRVFDPIGNVVHERRDLRLSDFGALDGEFALAAQGAIGWHRFELKPPEADGRALEPLRVLVSEFVPAPFRLQAELRAQAAHAGETIPAQLRATLHAGGPFGGAKARVVARIVAAPFVTADPLAKEFAFDSRAREAREFQAIKDRAVVLDAAGEALEPISVPQGDIVAGQLVLEASAEDDRGRSVVAQASLPYLGRDRLAGLRYDGWLLQQGEATAVDALVVDERGAPVRGLPYYVKVERQHTLGARVRGAGSAYLTRYATQWQRVATCKGRSRKDGMPCAFTPPAAGSYRITAMVRDTQDRLHETQLWLHAQGKGEVLWEDAPDYSLQLRAERDQYRAGEMARLLVKNPFPGARALVTVERYGVLDHWVQTLEGAAPVLRVPLKPEYLPGVYVSVVAMSPRVAPPPDSRGVDLGKPTFRMGYAKLEVTDPARAVEVSVTPARAEYRPRDTARVELQARAPGGPLEFAVTVLDEAVFDLIRDGQDYFDPLKGFTRLDALDLSNYSLLTRLVGRQKFEKKGANAGGDGGGDPSLRSVEKFVAYWNPALPADGRGRAAFEFALPDNLTGWRVLALAVTPGERMGLGQGTIKVSRPTELRPAMPNQVTAGDRFEAAFTVLNRAQTARELTVTLRAEGAASAAHEERVGLQPFERKRVAFMLAAEKPGELRFSARAADGVDADALEHRLTVRALAPSITAASHGSMIGGESMAETVQLPASLLAGELRLAFAPSVIGQLDGAFAHLRDYPYACWEQRLTRAVMAAHFVKLRERVDASLQWPQAGDLPQAALDEAASFQAPGGGMSFWLPQDAYQNAYLSAFTLLAFGWLEDLGYRPPVAVREKLHGYLQQLLRESVAVPGFDSVEARAQVRAVILAGLARDGRIDAAELERHAPLLPRMGLFGEALFLAAANRTPGAQALAREAATRVLARGQESAGRLVLRETGDRDHGALLGSELRSNCAALSALSAQNEASAPDAPQKLARAIGQARGRRDHWPNTQENLFCTRALIDYATRYEAAPVDLALAVALGEEAQRELRLQAGQAVAASSALTAAAAGQSRQVSASAQGSGRAYWALTLKYSEASGVARAANAGLAVARRYRVWRGDAWQVLAAPMTVARGERIRVDIEVQVPAGAAFVVVDDPVPGGIEPIDPELATASGFDAGEAPGDSWPFYHRELRWHAVRHYADWVEAGTYQLAWIGQAIASGEFLIPAVHAEQMYDPDVFGNGVPERLVVR